ncbi:outer membrane usher protein FanD, partial [Striga asiatica]
LSAAHSSTVGRLIRAPVPFAIHEFCGKLALLKNIKDHGCKLKHNPLMKPSLIIEDGENGVSKSSAEATDTEVFENESLVKEIFIHDEFQRGSKKSIEQEKDVEVTECSPVAVLKVGTQDTSKLLMNAKQNREYGLARKENDWKLDVKLARERMVQLKLPVAESVRH